MSIKITIPNTSSDVLTFGSANTPTAAQIAGIDSGSSNGQLALYTTASGTSTERVRVDTSGRLLVGTTGDISAGGYFGVGQFRGSYPALVLSGTEGSGKTWQIGENAGALTFYETVGGERMRIDSSGNLLVGNTTNSVSNGGTILRPTGECFAGVATGSNAWHVWSTSASVYRFYVSAAGQINATSTSITAISDQSLKENIRDLETGLSEVMALKPRRFDWKEETGLYQTNVAGFIAQELETVLPELVYEYQYNEETTKKSIKMGDILPTLVKAIQEMKAIIDTQAERISVLEAK